MNNFIIKPENPESDEATSLLTELSQKLAEITGNDGKSSFDISDMFAPRSLFVVAKNKNEKAVGCGAIRPISDEIAEIKRMYSKEKGVGTAVLKYLETKAFEFGYKELRLETRRVNEYAVNFYLKNGFREIPNYGKYAGRPEAVCFSKIL
jgi:GNAT superfamily N-acetyltransferase